MDERERVEHYLAWRKARRKDPRGRFYRRLRIAGTGVALAVLVIGLGAALAGWPRLARRDIARPALPATRFASRSELTGPAVPAPVLSATAPPALSATAPMAPENGREQSSTPTAVAPEIGHEQSPTATAVAPENDREQSSAATAVAPARRTTSPRLAARPRSLPPRKTTERAELPPRPRVVTEWAAPSGDPSASMRQTGSPALENASAAPLKPVTDSPTITARVNESPVPSTTLPPRAADTPLPAPAPPLTSGSPVPTSPNASVVSPRNTTAVAPTVLSPPAPATRPPDERIERLKHLAGYIPEVWLARHVARWVKQQPADEPGAAPLHGPQMQAR